MMTSMQNFTTPQASYFELGHTAGYMDGYSQACKDQQEVLTKAEIDVLVNVMRLEINMYENLLRDYKVEMNYLYERCDKNNSETTVAFKSFKTLKSNYSKACKQRNKLAALQSKLKKMRGF